MRSARIRAIASDGPPAENGTMMVMGRDGKFCATAAPPRQHQQAAKQSRICFLQLPFQPHGEERGNAGV